MDQTQESTPPHKDFDDFQDEHLRVTTMLKELQEKRVEYNLTQRELSKWTMKASENERMLESERRSLAGLQVQLDFQTQLVRKKESEAESATQKATMLEVQLGLANQEIGVLRNECQNLEVQVLDMNEKAAELEEKLKNMTAFKELCSGLQEKVTNYMALSEKQTALLKTEVSNLKAETEKSCRNGVDFEATVSLFESQRNKQEQEFSRIKQVLMDRKKQIEELKMNLVKLKKPSAASDPLISKISELQRKSDVMEERLENERKISRQLKNILSKAVQSQETLQALESEASAKLSAAEAKLAATISNEESLKMEINSLREELSKLEMKKNTLEKSVQTEQAENPAEKEQEVEKKDSVEDENKSESAKNLDEVKRQFQSAIAASGDDWTQYENMFKQN
ncbi:myosin-9-like [Cloeon dipterum]|uniref:myosin-9-like n=1 Tax=Cloeon dipterum TaxID=197152 RepID=UPI00321FFD80